MTEAGGPPTIPAEAEIGMICLTTAFNIAYTLFPVADGDIGGGNSILFFTGPYGFAYLILSLVAGGMALVKMHGGALVGAVLLWVMSTLLYASPPLQHALGLVQHHFAPLLLGWIGALGLAAISAVMRRRGDAAQHRDTALSLAPAHASAPTPASGTAVMISGLSPSEPGVANLTTEDLAALLDPHANPAILYSLPLMFRPSVYVEVARHLYDNRRFDEANKVASAGVEVHGLQSELVSLLIHSKVETQNMKLVQPYVQELKKDTGEDRTIEVFQKVLQFEGKFEEAESVLLTLLRDEPFNVKYIVNYVSVLVNLGREDDARDLVAERREVIAANPEEAIFEIRRALKRRMVWNIVCDASGIMLPPLNES